MSPIPFSKDQFFGAFAAYNQSIGSAKLFLYLLAIFLVWLCLKPGRWSSRLVWLGLAALWLWTGLVYHLVHFRAVTPAAIVFAALFITQGLLFTYAAAGTTEFRIKPDRIGRFGMSFILYALVVYPAIGVIAGHQYPALPVFAAPCPLTIFTFGVLLWTDPPRHRRLLILPTLWALTASTVILRFGVWQDLMLPVAALIAIAVFSRGARSPRQGWVQRRAAHG